MELAKRYGVLYVLLLTLTHCGVVDDPVRQMPDCSKYRCEAEAVKFTPKGPLVGVADGVLRRLAAATGRTDLGLANEGGVPVFYTEHIVGKDGEEVCGQTTAVSLPGFRMYTQKVEIDPTPPPGCPSIWLSVLHEFMHAIAPDVDHAAGGVFAPVIEQPMNGAKAIDEMALVQVCSEFGCQDFAPEL